ncbi:MAG: Rrf2 family transcriptional regulator [Gemmatimonadaceae bacterium]|jgi:Rrf2 family nitric oxide-sensitive transcriptional repressor|nr:Rrf2 family transcriptional regulator [Gemmatimonadaceae bacterium]
MRLTQFTDNALRCLIYLGVDDARPVAIAEIAEAMGCSEDHLGKVVQRLAACGYVQTVRGRAGGVRLAKAPSAVNIGQVVRDMEGDFALVACFDPDGPPCPIASVCQLAGLIDEALAAFHRVLDQRTLQDVLGTRRRLKRVLVLTS